MAEFDETINMANILAVLSNEEELIIKPLQPGKIVVAYGIVRLMAFCPGAGADVGAIECGKIVSRLNKPLFDYQIGAVPCDDDIHATLSSLLFR